MEHFSPRGGVWREQDCTQEKKPSRQNRQVVPGNCILQNDLSIHSVLAT
jgi:hypothetical protein